MILSTCWMNPRLDSFELKLTRNKGPIIMLSLSLQNTNSWLSSSIICIQLHWVLSWYRLWRRAAKLSYGHYAVMGRKRGGEWVVLGLLPAGATRRAVWARAKPQTALATAIKNKTENSEQSCCRRRCQDGCSDWWQPINTNTWRQCMRQHVLQTR